MKVLITGANGQLGYELKKSVPVDIDLYCVDVKQLDITQARAVNTYINDLKLDAVINAAAYTAVDKAETEQEIACKVNESGAENLAAACADAQIPLIHISTDFIFDGTASTPYTEDVQPNPVSVYGDSKLKGEQAIIAALPNNCVILRTAWVYSTHGNNFVKTMLRLMQDKNELGIICDQLGTPTWAHNLALCCWSALLKKLANQDSLQQIYHFTDAGVASWYDFAVAIQEEAVEQGLLNKTIPLHPINASSYPAPAKRPAYCVLDKTAVWDDLDIPKTHWRKALRSMMAGLKA